jgi:hypothetical protein
LFIFYFNNIFSVVAFFKHSNIAYSFFVNIINNCITCFHFILFDSLRNFYNDIILSCTVLHSNTVWHYVRVIYTYIICVLYCIILYIMCNNDIENSQDIRGNPKWYCNEKRCHDNNDENYVFGQIYQPKITSSSYTVNIIKNNNNIMLLVVRSGGNNNDVLWTSNTQMHSQTAYLFKHLENYKNYKIKLFGLP